MVLGYILACAPIIGALATIVTACVKLFKNFQGNKTELAQVKSELAEVKTAFNNLKAEVHKATVAMTKVETDNIRESK